MKLLVFALLLTATAFGQPKKCKTIGIINNLPAATNYQNAGRILAANGWGIATANQDFGTITTQPQAVDGFTVTLNILCMDGQIKITGTYNVPLAYMGTSQILFTGMNGSPAKTAWNTMNEAALLLGEPAYFTD